MRRVDARALPRARAHTGGSSGARGSATPDRCCCIITPSVLQNTQKSAGDRLEPCGTPASNVKLLDKVPFTSTRRSALHVSSITHLVNRARRSGMVGGTSLLAPQSDSELEHPPSAPFGFGVHAMSRRLKRASWLTQS